MSGPSAERAEGSPDGPYDGGVQWAGASRSAERLAAAMAGDSAHARQRWARSGGMHLTGRADGPPLAGPARVAVAFDEWAAQVAELTARLGRPVVVDGAALIGERAAVAGLTRRGATSAGGGCRLLPASDGWVAVSLARADDVDALDAWLEDSLGVANEVPLADEAWRRVAAAVATHGSAELVERAVLLGLPCARLGERLPSGGLFQATALEAADARSLVGLTVVDLSSLWAGPLCAHLLGAGGARVVKVESTTRPDGARLGPADFYDLLHAGHASVALDLRHEDGRAALVRLLERADVVIEASRPRALVSLGASFGHLHDAGWRGRWVSITGHGGEGTAADRVAFGDDAAVAGGLVAHDRAGPVFCADAIADPATGLLAATAVLRALNDGVTGHLALSLAGTAAHLAAGVRGNRLVTGEVAASLPIARQPRGVAAALGADTERWAGA